MDVRSNPSLTRSSLAESLRGQAEWLAPALLVAFSSVAWGIVDLRVHGPWFIPDEVTYAELGKSLYRLGHFEILGERPGFFSLVYPLFLGPSLVWAGIERGYTIAKELQAVAMSLAAVPVYCLARSVVPRLWALVAAALALALPGLALTGFLMTEVLFYPAFCLSVWLIARVLVRPTLGFQALAFGSILLVALTRLQGALLAPAFILAAVLAAALSRTGLRLLRSLAPSLAAVCVGACLWIVVALAVGRNLLGAYEVTTTSGHYTATQALKFLIYHAADVALLTGVIPVAALVLLTASVVQRRETAPEIVALVSVAIAMTVTFVPFVAVYAAGFTGRIAERNLFFLAPLFFTALVAWLMRAAPRPRVLLRVTAAALLVLVLITPWNHLVVPAAEPDAFTFVPFVDLHGRFPGIQPAQVIGLLAAALLVLLVGLPRRLLPLVPLLVGLLLVAAAVSTARYTASTARGYSAVMAGAHRTWIDEAAPAPVDFLYSGEQQWSGGGPAWTNVFWNDRIARVDELFGSRVAGGGAHAARVAGDGVLHNGAPPSGLEYVVAATTLRLVGNGVVTSPTGYVLWRIEPPLRLVSRVTGMDPVEGALASRADLIIYGCRGGTAQIRLVSRDDRSVRIGPREVRLAAGVPWSGEAVVPAPARPGRETCDLALRGTAGVQALQLNVGGG
jgi:hypothetical protein